MPGGLVQKGALELRRVGLPEGEDLDAVLEVAAQKAGADVAGEDFAGVRACHEELEVVAVFGDAEAALNEGADFEGQVARRSGLEGVSVAAGGGLRGGESSGGEQKDEDADGRVCNALRAVWSLLGLPVRMLRWWQKKGRR